MGQPFAGDPVLVDGVLPILAPVPMTVPPSHARSHEQWRRIGLGHESRDMDDKWHVFVEDGLACLHRTWTGHGIHEASFSPADVGGRLICAAVVESDPSRHRGISPDFDRALLELVLCGLAGVEDTAELSADFAAASARIRDPGPSQQ